MTRQRAIEQSPPKNSPPGSPPTQVVDVDVFHLRLPFRSFRISYKVAEAGKFSLTTEFLLRLLRSSDGLGEQAVAEFFGFSSEETRFVVDDAENLGYVIRISGRVYLTEGGHNLFCTGDEPALFEVRAGEDRFDFDLIAFAPVDGGQTLSRFEWELPELGIMDIEVTANASQRIISAFRRHFRDFRLKRGGSRFEKQSLYTVDNVQPEKRYSTLVPVTISVRSDNPTFPEVNLLSWKTGSELEDRSAVVQSCSNFVRNIRVTEGAPAQEAAKWLVRCAPDHVSRFFRNDLFVSEAFFKSTMRQAGELRIDRATVRVIGNVWTDANRTRFASALEYSKERQVAPPSMALWLRPTHISWGVTTHVPGILAAVVKEFHREEVDGALSLKTIMISDYNTPLRFFEAFNAVVRVSPGLLPQALEVFLVTGRLSVVLVHTPIGAIEGYPVPLGIVSFDPKVVERVHGVISDIVTLADSVPEKCDWTSKNLLTEMDEALDFSAKGSS